VLRFGVLLLFMVSWVSVLLCPLTASAGAPAQSSDTCREACSRSASCCCRTSEAPPGAAVTARLQMQTQVASLVAPAADVRGARPRSNCLLYELSAPAALRLSSANGLRGPPSVS